LNRYTRRYREEETRVAETRARRFHTQTSVKKFSLLPTSPIYFPVPLEVLLHGVIRRREAKNF